MKRHRLVSLLLCLVLSLSLGGCEGKPSSTRAETHLRLRNGTGWDIVALSLCESSANTGYQKNLLVQDYVLRNGAWIDIDYPHSVSQTSDSGDAAKASATAEREEKAPALQPEYRMLMVLADGRYFELSKFPIDDMSEGTLLLEEGVGYLSYLSLSSRQQVSTKGAEHATVSMFGKAEVDLSAVLSTAASRLSTEQASDPDVTPTPRPTMRPVGDSGVEDEEGYDPNEGCLVGGLFY
jgi:hypothetical protein